MQQVGPYHCLRCDASEAGPYEDYESRPDYDAATGWYKPGSAPGDTANVDADALYRAIRGVDPRYRS